MKPDTIAIALAGTVFGLVAGWVIGAQYTATRAVPVAAAAAPASQTAQTPQTRPEPPPLDEAQAQRLRADADANPRSPAPRIALANLYFDSERYSDAVTWYEQALQLDAANADVSTDLGVSYYYLNQPDRALQQFQHSLEVDPKHTKTILNMGIVRAFGKQDLAGAVEAWEQVIEIAPDSPEGRAAQQALKNVRAAHPDGATQ